MSTMGDIARNIIYTNNLLKICVQEYQCRFHILIITLTTPGDQGCKLGGYTGIPPACSGLCSGDELSWYSSSCIKYFITICM